MTRLPAFRRSEWVLSGFFVYMPALALWRTHAFPHPGAFAWLIPVALLAAARIDRVSTHRGWSFVRDWVPALLVLVAYWSVDWAPKRHVDRDLEQSLIGWDRMVLYEWGLRAGVERLGPLVPAVLELAYLLLYAVLPLTIAGFYVRNERDRLDDFLFPFLLGTLMTYSLLPHFPSVAPRFVFPGQDLPRVETVFRQFNLWILDHGDIRSSIFPSGHVAVGFSAAFAMALAVPDHRGVAWTLLTIAVLVWINTIYGRYHYAADGLVALAVSGASIGLIAALRRVPARTRGR
jgi:membrane-associated phospholipid phosphatase